MPEAKPENELTAEIESNCCVCERPWDKYRGNFKCAGVLPPPIGKCAVPVLVCTTCQKRSDFNVEDLACPLCKEGYVPAKVSIFYTACTAQRRIRACETAPLLRPFYAPSTSLYKG